MKETDVDQDEINKNYNKKLNIRTKVLESKNKEKNWSILSYIELFLQCQYMYE